jgi:hypothetical protein
LKRASRCRTNRRNQLLRQARLLRGRSRAFLRAVHLNVDLAAYTMKPGSQISTLGIAALCSVVLGALGSLAFMYLVGRHNNSIVLIALFSFWVSSPFVANVWVWFTIIRTSGLARATYFSAMLAISLGSLVIYGYVALGAPMAKPAFPFLIIPLASWVVVVLVTASLLSRKRKHESA